MRSRRTTQPRRVFYFVDGAIRNAALQRGLAPLDNPAEMGVLLENAAAAGVHALAEQTGHRLYHWRDRRDEVDLVLDDPARPLAFEIGSSTRHPRNGLVALMSRQPRFRGGCYVVAPDAPNLPPERSASGVGSVPLDMFLVAVGRQTAAALQANLGR